MKPLLFVVNEHDKDTVIIEKDRLECMLRLAYEEGYKEGQISREITYTPYKYGFPNKPIEFTCENKTGGNQCE